MNIYNLLSSKPHNPHYLKRYYAFIESCRQTTSNPVVEKHHICPKAKDLFPEFSSFAKNPWNLISLSPRQHFIAHLLLWKTFGGRQTHAFHLMSNVSKYPNTTTTYIGELPPTAVVHKYIQSDLTALKVDWNHKVLVTSPIINIPIYCFRQNAPGEVALFTRREM